jgi:hypothetical protein
VIIGLNAKTAVLKVRSEREGERKLGVVLTDTVTVVGGQGNNFFSVLKVPRQCPLVLLEAVKIVFSINSTF